MNPKWYSLNYCKTILKTKTEQHNITLTIHKFNKMIKTKAMLDECPMKCSIFQVPDSQFQLKLIFRGRENEIMEIYYITNSSIYMNATMRIEAFSRCHLNGIYVENSKYFNIFEITTYRKVLANKWQYCALFNTNCPDYEILRLGFVFMISPEVLAKHEVLQTDAQTQLSDDFGNLLIDGKYSDVTIKSAEGVEFKVHKNILATRSAVLKAHFDHGMRESMTHIVETPWETEVLKDLLNYVYKGTVPQVNEPVKLLAAADYYQLDGLKAHCETALYTRLTVENAIETLELADLYSAKKLFDDTLAFIKDGRARLIINTEGWSKIQSTSILKKLYEGTMVNENDIEADKLEEAYEELGEEFFK